MIWFLSSTYLQPEKRDKHINIVVFIVANVKGNMEKNTIRNLEKDAIFLNDNLRSILEELAIG